MTDTDHGNRGSSYHIYLIYFIEQVIITQYASRIKMMFLTSFASKCIIRSISWVYFPGKMQELDRVALQSAESILLRELLPLKIKLLVYEEYL